MKPERSTSPRSALAVGLGALLLLSGTLVVGQPAAAQESSQEALVQRLRAQKERQAVVEAEVRARQEEKLARERALQEAQARLRELPDGIARLRIDGPGGLILSRGPSVEAILARADDLELDDEQIDSIRAAHRDSRRAEIERDAAIQVAQLDLEDLMADDDAMDLDAVEAKMTEIAGLRVQSRMADLRLRQQVRSILTPEQREQLEDMGPRILFRTRADGPDSFLFRHDAGNQWRRQFEDRWPWLERLEPLRGMRWFRFDDDDDHGAEDSDDDQGEIVGT